MRTLSAAAEARRGRFDNSPLFLLAVNFTSPSAYTLRMSSEPVTAAGLDWQGLVKSWGPLQQTLEDVEPGGRPGTYEVELFNSVAVEVSRGVQKTRLSDLIRTPNNTTNTWEWANAKATLYYLLDRSLGAGDEVTLGVFYLEDPQAIGEDTFKVRMSTVDLLVEDKMTGYVVSQADFPNADPDAVGRGVPYILGLVSNSPCLGVAVGEVTKLASILTNPATGGYMEVTSTQGLAPPLTVQVDTEQIIVSSITPNAGSTPGRLYISSRGANGTPAAPHGAGATVLEVRSSFTYVAAQNSGNFKHRAVNAVKVNDRLLPTTSYSVNLDNTTLKAGKSFVSVTLTIAPTDVKAVYMLAAGQTQMVATNVPATAQFRNRASGLQDFTWGTVTLPSLPASVTVKQVRRRVTLSVSRNDIAFSDASRLPSFYSTINGVQTWLGYAPCNTISNPNFLGGLKTDITFDYVTAGYGNDVIFLNAWVANSGDNVDVTVSSYVATIELDNSGSGGNSAGDVVLGSVTVDIDGILDDASGTISGTAGLLMRNPADQSKFIVSQLYPGITTADVGTTWASTRASTLSAGYVWDFRLEPPMKFSDFRRAAGLQARSVIYVDSGKVEMKYLVDAPAADDTLDYLLDVYRENPAQADRTPRTQVWNTLNVYSARDYRKSGDLKTMYVNLTTAQDLTIGGFTDPTTRDVELTFVQDSATATALGTFWLGRLKRQQFRVPAESWWNAIRLQLGDYFSLTSHPILLAHGDSGLVFRVVGVSRDARDPLRVVLTGVLAS